MHEYAHVFFNCINVVMVFSIFRLDYGKKRGNTKEEKERERMKHKYKKEFKGALREIRKDTRFLAHTKLTDTLHRSVHYRGHYIVHIITYSTVPLPNTHTHSK